MRKTIVAFGVLIMVLGGSAAAQTGYYPIEEMGLFADSDLEVDIDLQGALLQLAAAALQEENEDLAKIVAGLDRVRVQVGTATGVSSTAVSTAFKNAAADLVSSGWNRILSVQDDEEQIYLFAIESGGSINGLTVLVNDGDEDIVAANLVGTIDPAVVGRVLAKIDEMPNLASIIKVSE